MLLVMWFLSGADYNIAMSALSHISICPDMTLDVARI